MLVLSLLTGETFVLLICCSVNDGVCLNMVNDGFWKQKIFFDVKVFNPLAPTYHTTSLAQCYRAILSSGAADGLGGEASN